VLDEPTSFLDIRYELELLTILRTMAKSAGLRSLCLCMSWIWRSVYPRTCSASREKPSHTMDRREIFRKDLIESLYDLTEGSYNPLFGSLEMRRAKGRPKYLSLQAAVRASKHIASCRRTELRLPRDLHENDVDYQVAKEIANQVIAEKAFERIFDQTFQRAVECMRVSGTVLNCLTGYGEMNERNRELFRLAAQMKIPVIKTCESLRVSEQPADKTNAC
jgi:iron complex transport system ATP-binding protein